jgi:HSP20 family protein
MSNLLNLVDSIFDSYPYNTMSRVVGNATLPAINVKEYNKNYKISLTAPGIDPKNIKVQVQDNLLTISYDHEDNKEVKEGDKDDGKLISSEYKHYSFSRSVSLPKNVNAETIVAESKNGILHLTIDKQPETQPKTIEVKVK